jgi:hypothetical protein
MRALKSSDWIALIAVVVLVAIGFSATQATIGVQRNMPGSFSDSDGAASLSSPLEITWSSTTTEKPPQFLVHFRNLHMGYIKLSLWDYTTNSWASQFVQTSLGDYADLNVIVDSCKKAKYANGAWTIRIRVEPYSSTTGYFSYSSPYATRDDSFTPVTCWDGGGPQPPAATCSTGDKLTETCWDGSIAIKRQCVNGQWDYLYQNCPVKPECTNGQAPLLSCWDGSKVTTKVCVSGLWAMTGNVCPPEPPPVCLAGDKVTEKCWNNQTITTQQCTGNAWTATGATCPAQPSECVHGQQQTKTCWDGSSLTTAWCVDGKWAQPATEPACPIKPVNDDGGIFIAVIIIVIIIAAAMLWKRR